MLRIHLGSVGLGAAITGVIVAVLFFGTTYFMQPSDIADGELIQGENSGEVYLIQDGKKRHILDHDVFEELGFSGENVRFVPGWIIDRIPAGMPIRTAADAS